MKNLWWAWGMHLKLISKTSFLKVKKLRLVAYREESDGIGYGETGDPRFFAASRRIPPPPVCSARGIEIHKWLVASLSLITALIVYEKLIPQIRFQQCQAGRQDNSRRDRKTDIQAERQNNAKQDRQAETRQDTQTVMQPER